MNKLRKGYCVSKETHEYLMKIKKENNLSSVSLALEMVVSEHEKRSRIKTEDTAKLMAKEIGKVLKDDVDKFKVSSRETDKNVQILIEMFNGYLVKSGISDIVTTTGLTTEFAIESPALKIAKEEVKKRLHRNKIMKENKINE
ncbi:hypothetical protein NSA50_05070 [Clostridium sp. DSM 100503]|uniref:hypothetical protein n=1 Tax=Clostridium sp. DSM 100503 TaxID=2963282 RepID=UPI00214A3D39|nr:hypothetical protein [Clostridium sp. DSM 100503]MCR1950437.1 hypothetical protein [Clostridium sp. DSM 100503]